MEKVSYVSFKLRDKWIPKYQFSRTGLFYFELKVLDIKMTGRQKRTLAQLY